MANGPFQLGLPNIPGLSSGPVNVGFNANGLAGQVRVPGLGPITFNFPGLTDISQPPTNQNFSINNFMQNLANHNETARSDKFDILLVPPASVAKYFGISPAAAAVGFNLQCEVSMLPGREIQTIEYTTHAFVRRVPQMNRFGAVNLSFICTGDMWEKRFFESWIDLMVPVQTGLVNYPLDPNNNRMYETDIKLNQYDVSGTLIYQANLIDSIPVAVAPLNQSWDNGSIHKLEVSFQFRKWTTTDLTYNQAKSFSGSNPSIIPTTAAGIVNTIASAPSTLNNLVNKQVSGIQNTVQNALNNPNNFGF